MAGLGKMLILFGLILVGAGAFLVLYGKIPFLGKLPGDVHIRKEHVEVFIPVTTSILLSVVISALLWLVSYLYKR